MTICFFPEDVYSILNSLRQANERTLRLAERYGLDADISWLCHTLYQGALEDVAAALGLSLAVIDTLTIPHEREVMRIDYQMAELGSEGRE